MQGELPPLVRGRGISALFGKLGHVTAAGPFGHCFLAAHTAHENCAHNSSKGLCLSFAILLRLEPKLTFRWA